MHQDHIINPSKWLQIVRNMISSADSPKQFRLWIFQVAVVLMHEVGGHLMVTFLGHGHVITPRIMTIAGFNSHVRPDNGESGRILETWLLGGVAEFQSDRRLRDDHVSERPRHIYIYIMEPPLLRTRPAR